MEAVPPEGDFDAVGGSGGDFVESSLWVDDVCGTCSGDGVVS